MQVVFYEHSLFFEPQCLYLEVDLHWCSVGSRAPSVLDCGVVGTLVYQLNLDTTDHLGGLNRVYSPSKFQVLHEVDAHCKVVITFKMAACFT